MGAEVERRQEITAEKAHEILKRISDEDCEALGASRARSQVWLPTNNSYCWHLLLPSWHTRSSSASVPWTARQLGAR